MKALLLLLATCHLGIEASLTPYDDYHYPAEETAERANATVPYCSGIAWDGKIARAVLVLDGATENNGVEGALVFGG
jgi:hypothetical protein